MTEQAEDPLGDILRRCHEDELLRALWTNLHLDPALIRSIVARLCELEHLADQYHNNEAELIKKFDIPVERLRQTHTWLDQQLSGTFVWHAILAHIRNKQPSYHSEELARTKWKGRAS